MIKVVRNAVKGVIEQNIENNFLEEIEQIRKRAEFLDVG
jgi:hypothetical protein